MARPAPGPKDLGPCEKRIFRRTAGIRDRSTMAVTFDHEVRGASCALVIHGVGSLSAVRHLCAELEHGAGPIDSIVVLDLASAPVVAEAAAQDLEMVGEALRRSRRWFGVVEPLRAATGSDGWYRTCGEAIDAGSRYLALVAGRTPMRPDLVLVVTGLAGAIAWVPELLKAAVGCGLRALFPILRRYDSPASTDRK